MIAAPAADLGLVGLGVMGHGFAQNAADHGFSVVAFDRDPRKLARLEQDAAGRAVRALPSAARLISALASPRSVLLLVPAGQAVDAVLDELAPLLAPGDLVIDGGNSFFRETERRARRLSARGLHYMGLGISGGAYGARYGPSLMPGGSPEDYERMRPLFEAVAARAAGLPCVAQLGPGAAGHYVKMVHNGIEYAAMQLIAETYDLLRTGLALPNEEIAAVYAQWNEGELRSFLLEIAARILNVIDEQTGERLVELIVDEAEQKGTGRWCSQDAMELGVPVPSIDVAVAMRELSAARAARASAMRLFASPQQKTLAREEHRGFCARLRGAFEVGIFTAYAQGMAQLQHASAAYGFGLDLAEVARIWRGGCIIRASLLERVQAAYRAEPARTSVLFAPDTASVIAEHLPELRAVIRESAALEIPVPALMSTLGYLDSLRRPRLPANLLQAQRDYFGGHGFERVDAEGTFHGAWGEASSEAD